MASHVKLRLSFSGNCKAPALFQMCKRTTVFSYSVSTVEETFCDRNSLSKKKKASYTQVVPHYVTSPNDPANILPQSASKECYENDKQQFSSATKVLVIYTPTFKSQFGLQIILADLFTNSKLQDCWKMRFRTNPCSWRCCRVPTVTWLQFGHLAMGCCNYNGHGVPRWSSFSNLHWQLPTSIVNGEDSRMSQMTFRWHCA